MMNDDLNQNFNYEEVCTALKLMHPLKASGEDGLRAIFYKHFWHLIGSKVLKFCTKDL